MKKLKPYAVEVLMAGLIIGLCVWFIVDRNNSATPQLEIFAPSGYEIANGYSEPYYNEEGYLRWKNKLFKDQKFYPKLQFSGGALFSDSIENTDIIIFIRKKK